MLRQNLMTGKSLTADLATFVIHEGKLYRMEGGKVWVESAVGQWLPMTWDLPEGSRLAVIHNRLFVNTSESLLELVPGTGEIKVLASVRNKPARTRLDSLPDLNDALFFAGPQGAIRVSVGDNIYQLPANGKDWQQITRFLPLSRNKKVSRDGLLFEAVDANRAAGFSALLPGGSEITELLSPTAPQFPVSRSTDKTGYWRWVSEALISDWATKTGVLDGRDFWLLYGPLSSSGKVKPTIDENYRLTRYLAESRDPLIFEPKFPPGSLTVIPGIGIGPSVDLLVADQHVVLVAPAESKAFILSKAMLNSIAVPQSVSREEMRKERVVFLEKRKLMWVKMYDGNQNGKLEPEEEATMKKNRQVQKDLEELKQLNERKP